MTRELKSVYDGFDRISTLAVEMAHHCTDHNSSQPIVSSIDIMDELKSISIAVSKLGINSAGLSSTGSAPNLMDELVRKAPENATPSPPPPESCTSIEAGVCSDNPAKTDSSSTSAASSSTTCWRVMGPNKILCSESEYEELKRAQQQKFMQRRAVSDPKNAKARNGKIFVGGLKTEISYEELMTFFGQFGNIVKVEMPFDKRKKQRKSFCFITFDSEQVVNDLLKTPKQTISGKEVDVKKATPKPDNMHMPGKPKAAEGRPGNQSKIFKNTQKNYNIRQFHGHAYSEGRPGNQSGNHNHSSRSIHHAANKQSSRDFNTLPSDRELLAAAKVQFSMPPQRPTAYRPTIGFQKGEVLNPYPNDNYPTCNRIPTSTMPNNERYPIIDGPMTINTTVNEDCSCQCFCRNRRTQ